MSLVQIPTCVTFCTRPNRPVIIHKQQFLPCPPSDVLRSVPPPPKTLQMRLNTSKVYILYYYAGTNWSICLLCLWLLSLKNKKKKKSIILWTVSKFLVILAVTDALEPLFILTHYGLLDDYKYTVSDPNN